MLTKVEKKGISISFRMNSKNKKAKGFIDSISIVYFNFVKGCVLARIKGQQLLAELGLSPRPKKPLSQLAGAMSGI